MLFWSLIVLFRARQPCSPSKFIVLKKKKKLSQLIWNNKKTTFKRYTVKNY